MSESRDRATALEVRSARLEDLEELVELQLQLRHHHRRLEPDNPRYLVADDEWRSLIERDLNDSGSRLFVAVADGAPRGFVKLSFVEKPWGMSCEMDTLVVDEGWRSRGIGERLVEAAERLAREAGAKGMRANVLLRNDGGRSFYGRMGYEEISVRYGKNL